MGESRVVGPINFEELRNWWHAVLRNHGRYKCYAIFLCLPSDKEAIRYLTDYGEELNLISGKDCLVMAFSSTEFKRISYDPEEWEYAVKEQVGKSYSVEIAEKFKIKIIDFPCVVFFDDVRSKNKETFTFKNMTAEEIAIQIRLLFTIIKEGLANKEKPLVSLQRHKKMEDVQRVYRSFWSKMFDYGEKSFHAAIEAWINTAIK